jgi:rhodanese-related sulfurtransferase
MPEKVQEAIAKVKPMLPHLLPLALVVMLALLISCLGQAPATNPEPTIPTYTDVTPEEAYEMTSQQEVVLLDVRTQEEYDSGHIQDTLFIPLSELESRLGELNPSDHILVYCRSGGRSAEAADILVTNGFTHVYNMVGGIIQWQEQGFPVYTEQTQTTSPEPTIPSYTNVTPEEAYEMINQQEVVVIDLRTQSSYDSGHIPDALLIPLSELEAGLGELNPTDYILVYHSCGGCSMKRAQILVDNGFLHVYNLEGGIGQWQTQGFPVTQEEECVPCG